MLLLVAAAVLVALRWDDLTAWMRIGGLIAVNTGVIAAGDRFRSALPSTSRALYELGACLIPISTVAAALQLDLPWQWTLLLGGATAFLGTGLLARRRPSWSLEFVAMASVIPLAGGIAALTHLPGGAVLAAAALGVLAIPAVAMTRWELAAGTWAAIAGSLAVLAGISDPWVITGDIVSTLGLGASLAMLEHIVVGAMATTALVVVANRRSSDLAAVTAIAVAVLNILAAFAGVDARLISPLVSWVALGLAIELVTLGCRRWLLWRRVLGPIALFTEVGLAAASLVIAGHAATVLIDGWKPDAGTPLAAGLLALAWFVADQRRRVDDCQSMAMRLAMGGGVALASVGVAMSVVSGVALLTESPLTTSWAALVVGAMLVGAGRGGAHPIAAALAVVAIAAAPHGWWGVAVAVSASLLLAVTAMIRSTDTTRGTLGAAGLLVVGIGALLAATTELIVTIEAPLGVASASFALGVMAITTITERATNDPVGRRAGLPGRAVLAIPAIPVLLGDASLSWLPLLIVGAVWAVLDLGRSGDNRVAAPLALLTPAMALLAFDAGDFSLAQAGIGLSVLVAAAAGATTLAQRWTPGAVWSVAIASGSAVLRASTEADAASTVLMVLGAAAMMVAAERASLEGVVVSSGVAMVGFWLRLGLDEVTWSEAYLAPVAGMLVVVGLAGSSNRHGSWWTHGLAVVVLGGAGLVERIAGGGGGHGLVAGVVAVLAMAAGARWRLIGPLVAGTIVIAGVAAHESLAYAASIPTWAWLALAGSALLATGVVIERTASSPVETGRDALRSLASSYR